MLLRTSLPQLVALCIASNSFAEPGGWISSSIPTNCFVIERNGSHGQWPHLLVGDKIWVHGADCTVYLMVRGPCCDIITRSESPYTVPAPRNDSLLFRLLETLSITQIFRPESSHQLETGNVRGLTLQSNRQVFVAKERRQLVLPIQIELVPARVRVRTITGGSLCNTIANSSLVSCAVGNSIGILRGTIEVLSGSIEPTISFQLSAVSSPAADCPRASSALSSGIEPSLVEALTNAIEIAKCGNDWRLEAYQHIVPYLATDDMAKLIGDYIQQGAIMERQTNGELP